jgi:hypothetical protein
MNVCFEKLWYFCPSIAAHMHHKSKDKRNRKGRINEGNEERSKGSGT